MTSALDSSPKCVSIQVFDVAAGQVHLVDSDLNDAGISGLGLNFDLVAEVAGTALDLDVLKEVGNVVINVENLVLDRLRGVDRKL